VISPHTLAIKECEALESYNTLKVVLAIEYKPWTKSPNHEVLAPLKVNTLLAA
ncbi:unnamed protein product, partial [Sphenostylis stenocarpa]